MIATTCTLHRPNNISVVPRREYAPICARYERWVANAISVDCDHIGCTFSRVSKTERLNIRISEDQHDLLRRAAEASAQTISDYVLTRVMADAQDDLADQRLFLLDAPQWTEFKARVNRPPIYKPELDKLLSKTPPWDNPLPGLEPQDEQGEVQEEPGLPALLELDRVVANAERAMSNVRQVIQSRRGTGKSAAMYFQLKNQRTNEVLGQLDQEQLEKLVATLADTIRDVVARTVNTSNPRRELGEPGEHADDDEELEHS